MVKNSHQEHPFLRNIRKNIIVGLFTIIPIWLTWLVCDLLLRLLDRVGGPYVDRIVSIAKSYQPYIFQWLENPWIQPFLAAAFIVVVLYFIGWISSRVIGKRIIAFFDHIIAKVPFIETIYGGSKKLVKLLDKPPGEAQRVVLIDFPSSKMKTVGLVTCSFKDTSTQRDLVAVYVPTTPNPTSGYLEIMPVENVTPTDWTVDQAMAFIVSGGAISPESMHYEKGAPDK